MFEEKPLAQKPPNKELTKKQKIILYFGVGATTGLILIGWFFSLSDRFVNFNFSSNSWNQLNQLKNSVENSASELRTRTEKPIDEMGNLAQEIAGELQATEEQKETAKNIIGETMKENLENTNP